MSEHMKGRERGEERRFAFEKAVRDFEVVEVMVDFDASAVESLETGLAATNLLLLGEVHGVKENPRIIYTLMKKFGIRGLALEWDTSIQPSVQAFLKSGKLDFDVIADSQDGRITAGHFALLRKLQEEKMLDAVMLFDVNGEMTWNERDERMSERILSERDPSIPTLVVAGDMHTKTETLDFNDPDDPGTKYPMAYRIRSAMSEAPVVTIEYASGSFYNYGKQDFDASTKPSSTVATLSSTGTKDFTLTLPQAYEALVPNRS